MNSIRHFRKVPGSAAFNSLSGRERVLAAIRDTGLCLITDDRLDIDLLLEATRRSIDGGVRLIQYRDKTSMRRQLLDQAARVQALCAQYEVAFVVNDCADVAAILGADGLHLGQEDLPAVKARGRLAVTWRSASRSHTYPRLKRRHVKPWSTTLAVGQCSLRQRSQTPSSADRSCCAPYERLKCPYPRHRWDHC